MYIHILRMLGTIWYKIKLNFFINISNVYAENNITNRVMSYRYTQPQKLFSFKLLCGTVKNRITTIVIV